MKLSVIVFALASFSAHAHIQIGTYKGISPDGIECSIKFDSVSFVTPFKNPLAERVTVQALNKTFVLAHPSKIDEASVLYNDESLEITTPLQGGAEYFKVAMIHDGPKEGPASFIYQTHDWKKNTLTKTTCENLVFQE